MDRGQYLMRVVGGHVDERREVELAAVDRLGDGLERADFRRREADARKLCRARAQHRDVVERIERGFEPSPDRLGAGGRELLRDHDGGEPGEAVRTLAQRRPSGERERVLEALVGLDQRGERDVEIGFGDDADCQSFTQPAGGFLPGWIAPQFLQVRAVASA